MTGPARRAVVQFHLWVGLTLGALFALLGLSGSALVFYRGIDAWMNPPVRASAGAQPASWEQVLGALHAANPRLDGAWRIEVQPGGGTVPARYMHTPQTAQRGFAPLLAWVDPASMRVVRQQQWGEGGMTWVYDLHYRLLAGTTGARIVGVAGLLALLLLLSGIYLWWPAPNRLKGALTLKSHAAPQRRVYDVHSLSGVYGLVLLAIVTATGALLDLPDQVKPLLSSVSTLHRPPDLHSGAGVRRIPADAAVAIAAQRFPGARLAWIETPGGARGVYRISLAQPHEPSQRFPRTNVWIDQYSGAVLAVRDPRFDSAGDKLLNWLHPLHNGEAFGLAGRLLAFVAGLLPALLFVTGVLRWRQKARAHARVAARRLPIRNVPKRQATFACARGADVRSSGVAR